MTEDATPQDPGAGPPVCARRHRRERQPLRVGPILLASGLLATACSGAASARASTRATCDPAPLSAACDAQTAPATLTGAGANSVNNFFARAFYDYHQANPGVSVNYAPSGSGVGISDIRDSTVDFGDSETPMPSPATGPSGTILQIPVALGGVALSYNLPGAPDGLKLDGPTLAGIFLGIITNWGSPAIAALNPGIRLQDLPVVAVHRADSSGPGYDLDQYLIDTGGPAWITRTGSTPGTHWPSAVAGVGLAEQANTGVASYIQQTPGAIGYVEYASAVSAGLHNAALRNAAGDFVAPSTGSIAAAGASASGLSPVNFNIVDGPGAQTYPLANFSWTLIYRRQAVTATGITLGRLFDWITSTEQRQAAGLGYSPLPANAAALAHRSLLSMEDAAGQPLF